MTVTSFCVCGEMRTPDHNCVFLQQQRARDNARRNQRPTTRARNTAAWRRTAARIRHRDKDTCQHCGGPGRIVDHIDPQAGDHDSNLQVLCHGCSGRKDGGRRYA